jgi:hypothetical protein
MKWLILVVAAAVVNVMVFNVKACRYSVHNLTNDSFSVAIVNNNPNVTITQLDNSDPSMIFGHMELPCERSRRRGGGGQRRKLFLVSSIDKNASENYFDKDASGAAPRILLFNENGEVSIVFTGENYAELQSSMALEIHDDPNRRERDWLYTQGKNVHHWIRFGPYVAMRGYEMGGDPPPMVFVICHWSSEFGEGGKFQIDKIKEMNCDSYLGIWHPYVTIGDSEQYRKSESCCSVS